MGKKPTLKERKREDIVQAAIKEFKKNGFSSTSMDLISETARVSKRTLYNHFSSKDLLFKTIVFSMMENAVNELNIPYVQDAPIRYQLQRIAESEMNLLSSEVFIDVIRIAMSESIRNPELTREITDEIASCEWGIVPWVRAAVEDGKLDIEHPEIAGHQFLGLIKTFAFYPQVIFGRSPLIEEEQEKIITSAIDIFMKQYAI